MLTLADTKQLIQDRGVEFFLCSFVEMSGAPKAHGCGQVRAIEIIGNEPIDGMYGSDHYGLAAELRY